MLRHAARGGEAIDLDMEADWDLAIAVNRLFLPLLKLFAPEPWSHDLGNSSGIPVGMMLEVPGIAG